MKNALCRTNKRIEEIKIRMSEIETFEYSIHDFSKMMVDRVEYDSLERELFTLNENKRTLEVELNTISHQDIIEYEIMKQGFEVGCIDPMVNKLTKKDLKNVIDNITGDSTDVDVHIRKTLHVVEIVECDREIDICILTQDEYISRYGTSRWNED